MVLYFPLAGFFKNAKFIDPCCSSTCLITSSEASNREAEYEAIVSENISSVFFKMSSRSIQYCKFEKSLFMMVEMT